MYLFLPLFSTIVSFVFAGLTRQSTVTRQTDMVFISGSGGDGGGAADRLESR